MEKREIRLEWKETDVCLDIICDICGNSCLPEMRDGIPSKDMLENPDKYGSYLPIDASWGYYSGDDLHHWQIDMCYKCAREEMIEHLRSRAKELGGPGPRRMHYGERVAWDDE